MIDAYLDETHQGTGLCECFQDGEEFIIDLAEMLEEFCARCPWAWANIRQDILTVAYRGDMPGMKQPGTLITGCMDWLRPVDDNTFDWVWSADCVGYAPGEPLPLLQELGRVIKPGGSVSDILS